MSFSSYKIVEIMNQIFITQACNYMTKIRTHSAIQNLVPDFIVGEAHKPHVPVA